MEAVFLIAFWFFALRALELLDDLRERFNPREYWAWLSTPAGKFAQYLAGEDSALEDSGARDYGYTRDTSEGSKGGPEGV